MKSTISAHCCKESSPFPVSRIPQNHGCSQSDVHSCPPSSLKEYPSQKGFYPHRQCGSPPLGTAPLPRTGMHRDISYAEVPRGQRTHCQVKAWAIDAACTRHFEMTVPADGTPQTALTGASVQRYVPHQPASFPLHICRYP